MTISTTLRTQADRSARTKAALADGAVEVLVENGWAATTVIEVWQPRRNFPGAFYHHYDNLLNSWPMHSGGSTPRWHVPIAGK
jgi:hypothetical protein